MAEIHQLREQVEPVGLVSLSPFCLSLIFLAQPVRPCRACFFEGRNCTWIDWASKCEECARLRKGRCSFEESPEERMDHTKAAHSWGLEALSCKFYISFDSYVLLILISFLAFRRLLALVATIYMMYLR